MATPIKFTQLTDKKWVLDKLQSMTVAELAKEVGCPTSSIRWVLSRYCSEEEVATIKVARKHKKKS